MAKLKPRARIIRTIGDQLISGPEAALIELVKNAYDADSSKIEIKIVPKTAHSKGMILIADSGHGMSYRDIVDKWLEPAHPNKKEVKTSPEGRIMLGAKGIGRFATARLGAKLKLKTTTMLSDGIFECSSLSLSWGIFTDSEYLSDIDIDVNHRRKKLSDNSLKTGVTLLITAIDTWSRKRLESLVRELRRLSSNIPNNEFRVFINLSKFTKKNSKFDGTELIDELNEWAQSGSAGMDDTDETQQKNFRKNYKEIKPFRITNYNDYECKGSFDRDGEFSGYFKISRGDGKKIPLEIPPPAMEIDESKCGRLDVEFSIYDREDASIESLFQRMGADFSKIGIRAARKILNDNAGIGIYRNHFRVRPYGEPDNDWLKLEGRRVINPSMKIGHIQISAKINIENEQVSGLVERSSREGLDHNSSFFYLNKLILGLLTYIEPLRIEFREKAGISRKATRNIDTVKEDAQLESIKKHAKKLPLKYQKDLLKKVDEQSKKIRAEIEQLEEYQKVLESRSALGLVVAQVVHDGRRYLTPIAESSKALNEGKDKLLEDSDIGRVIRSHIPFRLSLVDGGVKGLRELFRQLDPVSGKKKGRPTTIVIDEVVKSALDLMSEKMIDADIFSSIKSVSPVATGYESDLKNTILNLIDNAIHWLVSGREKDREITFDIAEEGPNITIDISNNGPVISDVYAPRIFEAGFTLKSEGHGLGLAIAREACRASGGDLYYLQDRDDTTFRIELPKG